MEVSPSSLGIPALRYGTETPCPIDSGVIGITEDGEILLSSSIIRSPHLSVFTVCAPWVVVAAW